MIFINRIHIDGDQYEVISDDLKVMVMMIIDIILIDDDAFPILQSKSMCTIGTADSAKTSFSLVHIYVKMLNPISVTDK